MQETIGLKDYISQKNRALAVLFFLSDRVGRIPPFLLRLQSCSYVFCAILTKNISSFR